MFSFSIQTIVKQKTLGVYNMFFQISPKFSQISKFAGWKFHFSWVGGRYDPPSGQLLQQEALPLGSSKLGPRNRQANLVGRRRF